MRQPESLTPEQFEQLAEVVSFTPDAQAVACVECGVLVWDVAKHYRREHATRARVVLG